MLSLFLSLSHTHSFSISLSFFESLKVMCRTRQAKLLSKLVNTLKEAKQQKTISPSLYCSLILSISIFHLTTQRMVGWQFQDFWSNGNSGKTLQKLLRRLLFAFHTGKWVSSPLKIQTIPSNFIQLRNYENWQQK